MTVTSIQVPVRTEPPVLGFRFEIDFNEATATVAYRAARTDPNTSRVLSIRHNAGRGLQVDWSERWRAYLAPAVRAGLVAEVQSILHRHWR